jgi:replicative superfamily II helicase
VKKAFFPADRYPDVISCKEKGVNPVTQTAVESELIPCSEFKWAYFPFEKFNPVQTSIFPYIEQDVNLVVATNTSSGKTVICEMAMSYVIRGLGGNTIYTGPFKALVAEKKLDWTSPDHHFSEFVIEECSGDVRISDSRAEALKSARVISITPELLASRMRNMDSEKSAFISNCSLLCLDEMHLVGDMGRGDAYELTVMQFVKFNPNVRFVCLSATMDNAEELGQWLSNLNGKKTVVLKSSYRPVKLQVDYVQSRYHKGYDPKMLQMVYDAYSVVAKNPKDKHLIFFHDKGTQSKALKVFNDGCMRRKDGEPYEGFPVVEPIKAEMYNADLNVESRTDLVARYINDPNFNVMLSTSSLGVGINLPAKRVILVGVERGYQRVELGDLLQFKGRAGRPKYDKEGYVTYILPNGLYKEYKNIVLQQSPKVKSSLALQHPEWWESWKDVAETHYDIVKNIAFHVIAEIKNGVNTAPLLMEWYKKTFGYFQNGKESVNVFEDTIRKLIKNELIRISNDVFANNRLANIAADTYYCPFDVSDYSKNMRNIHGDPTDDEWAFILSNTESHRVLYISKAEAAAIPDDVMPDCQDRFGTSFVADKAKAGCAKYYAAARCLLSGVEAPGLQNAMFALQNDNERTVSVLQQIDGLFGLGLRDHLPVLSLRLKYGVPEYLVSLVKIPNIGKSRAVKLFINNIRTPDQFLSLSNEKIHEIIGVKDANIINEMRGAATKLVTSPCV